MSKLVIAAALALGACVVARAQEETSTARVSERDASADFTSASRAHRLPAETTSRAFAQNSLLLRAGEPEPAPPEPRFVFGGRDDFRYQLGIGVAVVRFRSSVYYATAVGTSTTLTYFTNEWFGIDGKVVTAFAPTINQNENVKYFSYGGGPKIAWRRARFEPWVHGIIGGGHILPQTALGGQNAFETQAGGGVDYRFNPRLSVRIEADWIHSRFFGQWQEGALAALEGVIHF